MLNVIDWVSLAANSLWILGCALALATFSYTSWQASIFSETLRTRLGKPGAQRALYASGVLFCAGLAASSDSSIETILWGILGILFCLGLYLSIRPAEKSEEEVPRHD